MSFFDREFVKTGIFPKDFSRSFHRAFEVRQLNDYGEISTMNEEEAKQILEEARIFVSSIDNYIKSMFLGNSAT